MYEYGLEYIKIAEYFIFIKKSKNIGRLQFRYFKRDAFNYGVYSRQLWRLFTKIFLIRLVVDIEKRKSIIIKALYD
jgi:hypothetical protein